MAHENKIDELIDNLKKNVKTPEQRAEDVVNYWNKRTKKFETVEDIPNIPCFNEKTIAKAKEYMEFIQQKMIELGAIPKDALVDKHTYLGNCRNAHKAVWHAGLDGGVFVYERTKFGCTYPEEINHFQDDNGYDVFVPIKDIDNQK